MRAPPSLELALFRKQKAHISKLLEPPSPAFRAYEARYRRRTRGFVRPLSMADVHAQVCAADVVYVGDYHTLRSAQHAYLELVRAALECGRRVVLALELVEGRFQDALDGYLSRQLSEQAFLDRLGIPAGGVTIWSGFRPVLELARSRGLEAVAIDRRAQGARSLELRDGFAAKRIAEVARAEDRPLVLVLMGQYHVAPCHLPAKVRAALGETDRAHLVVYQNCESLYWKALPHAAVEVRPGELCLLNSSPVLCQQTFLDHVEAESGDTLLPPDALPEGFRRVAKLIARQVGLGVEASELDSVAVCAPADGAVIDQLRARARFSEAELETLRQKLLDRDSFYVPRAKLAYLASLSLADSAEEAAHFLRHCCVGDAMDRERSRREAFYARCLEEALGFAGSRLVHPDRAAPRLSELADTFHHGRGVKKAIAAFVLAHRAGETNPGADRSELVPQGDLRVFDGVTHTLGYLLGDVLDRRLRSGAMKKAELGALFKDRFEDPEALYFSLCERPRKRRS